VALKKSELYSSLWSSCDELRGGMDASQYKDYILVLLLKCRISTMRTNWAAARISWNGSPTITVTAAAFAI